MGRTFLFRLLPRLRRLTSRNFTFLGNDKWKEYGKVYKLTRPGHLSVYTNWKDGPSLFEFTLTRNRMIISQDGKELGSAGWDPRLTAGVGAAEVTWGMGMYGPLSGKIVDTKFSKN